MENEDMCDCCGEEILEGAKSLSTGEIWCDLCIERLNMLSGIAKEALANERTEGEHSEKAPKST